MANFVNGSPIKACTGIKRLAFLQSWPGVSMILPVRGCKASTIRNWESQLNQSYGESALDVETVGLHA